MKKVMFVIVALILMVGLMGVEKDYIDLSIDKLLDLAKKGDIEAQYQAGIRYVSGKGVTHDYEEGMKWLRMSADRGYVTAQYVIGMSYALGEFVKQDFREAAIWLRKAADQTMLPHNTY